MPFFTSPMLDVEFGLQRLLASGRNQFSRFADPKQDDQLEVDNQGHRHLASANMRATLR
jgi:hypothetical protein